MTVRPKILIVDDKPENLFALEKTLQKLEVEIFQAKSGNEALGLSLEHEFCLAIVDVQMPEMDGYEFVELLRGNEITAELPVIFVSAIFSDEYHHRKGYDSGAVDFMSKPYIPEIMISKVRVFIELYNHRMKLQDALDELNHANLMLTRRTHQLEIINKIGQQVTSTLDLKTLLPQVAQLIQAQFGFTMVGIWLADNARQQIVLEASTKNHLSSEVSVPMDHKGLVAQSCSKGKVILENKASTNPYFVPTHGLQMVGSELALPLKIQNEILGVLDVQSERPQVFVEEDTTVLETLTAQIVIAIRNARLYSQAK
jgi:DNA-binding response OmpR family regulator